MAGIAGFLAVRDGIPWWFSRHDSALSQAISQQAEGAFAPLAWILLLLWRSPHSSMRGTATC
ncbi:hypothetical protein [Xanthomonas rydalmerensis]|nr:hypothetical protein [Xanthomonas sp. DM-2023]WOS41024.1 hypothetical protein QN243_00575 [Xanthomonas sp. DM-2023]WOS45209.1 hypothetical protein QN242_00575 [Xanthomonas sp. DM-2023]WOS49388.1 hypothetical protein QN240_00575 [Xanthomonas sp. DM-2023]WOS53568.1 hypothetical protein QN244_00575 [Xanthomonas sp. DM-2023]WOS57751.1 hypothetical protein QN245_00575 [Xanthomonas sp. DM-2023]